MGFFDKARTALKRRGAFPKTLEEARNGLLVLDTYIRERNTQAAAGVCHGITEQLAELSASASDSQERLSVAQLYFEFAIRLRQLQHDNEAEPAYQAALRLSTSECRGKEQDQARRVMAACHNHLGILHYAKSSDTKCAQYYREALALREALSQSCPSDAENRVYLGGVLCNLGNVAKDQNELETALCFYHRSIDILDSSIPGCDCGCRDSIAALSGQSNPTLLGQQFLRNALQGRAAVLDRKTPGQRFQHVRCSQRANSVVVSILTERLTASGNTSGAQGHPLEELRRELLDAVSFARGSVILDVQAVREIDSDGVALLLHLRGRLVGGGEWPLLCGLSNEVRAETLSVAWEELFGCYATVDAALEHLEAEVEPRSDG
jgi:tetratricopeptide (TPR) repeat protein